MWPEHADERGGDLGGPGRQNELRRASRDTLPDPTPDLSLIVPAFNAAMCLADSLTRLASHLRGLSRVCEVIVVDDGSTDTTADIAARFAAATPDLAVVVLRAPQNEGKGAAVRRGLHAARGRFALFLDADLEYAPEQIEPVVRALDAGADVVIANRDLPDSRLVLHQRDLPQQTLRYASGRVLSRIVRAAVLPGLRDTQAGLKGLRMSSCRGIADELSCRGFGFDIELLLLARERSLAIHEVPVRVDSRPSTSTVRMATDALGLLRDVCVILFRQGLRRLAERTQWEVLRPAGGPLLSPRTAAVVGASLVGFGGFTTIAAHWNSRGGVAVLGWLCAWLGAVVLGRAVDGDWRGIRPPRFTQRGEILVFFALFAVVTGLRLWRLDSLPATMHGDSAECGLLGRALLLGQVKDVFDFSPWYFTPFLSFIPYALSFAAFDVSIFALRVPSACLGIAAAVPLYFMTRSWFGVRVAQIALALFAFSHPLVHFSRIGLWNNQVVFFQLCAFAFLAGALARRSVLLAVLAGLTTGYGLYSYTAARLIPLLCLAIAGAALLRGAKIPELVRRIALPYLGGCLIAVLPLAVSYVKTPDAWATDRAGAVSVFAETNHIHVAGMYGEDASAWDIFWGQTGKTLQGIALGGDASPQYGNRQPMLSPVSVGLLVLGIGACLWGHSSLGALFVPIWFVVTLVLGSIVVIDPPSYTRLIGMFPANCILIAFGAERVWAAIAERRPLPRRAGVALASLFLLQSGWSNASTYREYASDVERDTGAWDIIEVMARAGSSVDYYLFTGPFLYADASVFRLWAGGARTMSAFTESDIPDRLDRDSVFVVAPDLERFGYAIEDKFPGAELDVVESEDHVKMFVYRCTIENGCRKGLV